MRVVMAPVTRRTSAWRGEATMLEAVLGEVVERVGGGGQLVLAAVARAGVDVAQRKRAARRRVAAPRCRVGRGAGG